MASEVGRMSCACQSIGAPQELRMCEDHHIYWLSDKRLASVSQVIREAGMERDLSAIPEDVLENARERGVRVNAYFDEWLNSGSLRIAAGERADVVDYTKRLIEWWEADDLSRLDDWKTQVMLHDDEVAGTCDILNEDWILDLKCTASPSETWKIQLGAYADLNYQEIGESLMGAGVIHVSAKSVKHLEYNLDECLDFWRITREACNLRRRLKLI